MRMLKNIIVLSLLLVILSGCKQELAVKTASFVACDKDATSNTINTSEMNKLYALYQQLDLSQETSVEGIDGCIGTLNFVLADHTAINITFFNHDLIAIEDQGYQLLDPVLCDYLRAVVGDNANKSWITKAAFDKIIAEKGKDLRIEDLSIYKMIDVGRNIYHFPIDETSYILIGLNDHDGSLLYCEFVTLENKISYEDKLK
ncbi:MAG: hypothetical protein MR210_02005 [Erysipelotrichaceae bacterium]|nr:hypothetical protein [Erysipelotrichaceae bacterium]MDY5252254.1 hypothetical protein [Erysipelotrichaceae bacterium]